MPVFPRAGAATSPKAPTSEKRRPGRPRLLLVAAAVLVLCAIGLTILLGRRPPAAPSKEGTLEILVKPADALVEIDGKRYSGGALTFGPHQMKVSRAGFVTLQQQIQIPAQSPVALTLEPLQTVVAIDTQPPQAEYSLDGQPTAALASGQATISGVGPGKHTLRIFAQTGAKEETLVEFETGVAQQPMLVRMQPAGKTIAIAVAQFGDGHILHSSPAGMAVKTQNGQQIGTTEQPLDRRGEPTLDYVVEGSENDYPIFLTAAESPVLNIFVRTYVPTGGLLVRVNEDEVALKLDGRPYGRSHLRKGTYNAFRGLPAGRYNVSVEREGFRAEPANARVAIAQGKDSQVDFRLVPIATVEIRDAVPGARVFINGVDMGVVGAGGTASIRTDGGPCRIEFRARKYYHRPLERQCSAPGTTLVAGADAAMVQTGYIHIPSVRPADAKIAAIRRGEPERVLTIPHTEVPVGSYIIRATAPGHVMSERPIQVIPDMTNEVGSIELAPAKK